MAVMVLCSAPCLFAQETRDLKTALDETRPLLDLRLRHEAVDQSGIAEDAQATTVRGRIGVETGALRKTTFLAEAELLWPLRSDYNSTLNGKTAFPIVADPESYEINRLQLTNTALRETTLIFGRQRINLHDQRFVGNVGWRQNEQTFDAVRVINKSIARLTIDITYLNQVNRILGKDSAMGRYHGDNTLANVSYLTAAGTLTGFAYWLKFDEAPADSTRTLGLRFNGSRPAGRVAMAYSVAYAAQRERANSPLDYESDYYALELNGTMKSFTLGAGVEVLAGDGVKGFTTPLATLHKFQGWADKFLTTPPNGIDDGYLTAAYAKKRIGGLDALTATASFHRYESERLSIAYGSEFDFQVQAKWRRVSGVLKYADYNARRFTTDTRKLWAQVEYVW